jgi:hypothetical protein
VRRGAFDRPGLGLVLQLVGVTFLPSMLAPLVSVFTLHLWSLEIVATAALGTSVLVIQIVTGVAMASRSRWAPLAFAIYAAGSVAIFGVGVAVMTSDQHLPAAMIIGMAIEAFGTPLVLAIVAFTAADSEPRTAGDLGAVLAVLAVAGAIAVPLREIQQVRLITFDGPGAVAMWGVRVMFFVAVVVLELVAALALLRAGWPAARKPLWRYVVVVIAGEIALSVLGVIGGLVDDIPLAYLTPSLVGLALIPIAPMIKWRFARRLPHGVDRTQARVATLGWIALALVPILAGRAWMFFDLPGELGRSQIPFGLSVLCATQAVVNAIAGIAAVRRSYTTYIYACAGAAVSVVPSP